jgi:hypothetical protein
VVFIPERWAITPYIDRTVEFTSGSSDAVCGYNNR